MILPYNNIHEPSLKSPHQGFESLEGAPYLLIQSSDGCHGTTLFNRILNHLSSDRKLRWAGKWKTVHRHHLKDDANVSPFLFFTAPGFKDIGYLRMTDNIGDIRVTAQSNGSKHYGGDLNYILLMSEFARFLKSKFADFISRLQLYC